MTQHHHTPPPDPMPLDPEERALAARLARLGPHGEPSPALDARVLAAAHAAATAHDARRAREHGWRRARWPVGVGVAASVVLAAGIAWQMRPLPAPQFPAGAPVSADAAMTTASASAHAPALPEDSSPSFAQVVSPLPPEEVAAAAAPTDDAAAATTATAARQAAASDVVAAKSIAASPPSPEEPPVVFDAPAPVAIAAPPPAPPAPPAPVAQAQAAQPVFDASDADAPEGDVPPATAASPQVRDAWLARIRELAANGHTDEARASLAEFHRRYPAFAIPADLRPLLPASTPAPPATPGPATAPATKPRPR